MRRRWNPAAALALAWLCVLLPPPLVGAPQAEGAASACLIVEGEQIAGLRLGLPLADALALTGPPIAQQARGRSIVYTLRPPWASMTVGGGTVERIATRSAACRTAREVGPGSALRVMKQAYATATASITVPTQGGDLISLPFEGVAFLVRRARVETVEIFPREVATAPRAPEPVRTPRAPAWTIRDLDARLDGTTLVVTGTIESRDRARLVYAEVQVLDERGRQVALADSPVHPNPVPASGKATFEVRIPIGDVIRRYRVVLRPIGSLTASLAELTGEIRDRQQFAPLVAQRLQAGVRLALDPARLVVEVRNDSATPVSGATAMAEGEVRCFARFPAPGRFIVTRGVGPVTLGPIPPGGSALGTLPLEGIPQGCADLVLLTGTARIIAVKLSE